MKTNKIIINILMLLPLAICIIALPFLPDTVPAHFDINMQVDRWGSKYELLVSPLTTILMVPLMNFCSKLASKQEGDGKNNEKIMAISTITLLAFLNVLNVYLIYIAFKSVDGITPSADSFSYITFGMIGLLFIILGNITPKAKMNSYVGLRTTWSMKNEVVWKKCQRLIGITMVLCGVAVICLAFFAKGLLAIWLSIGIILFATIFMTVSSYVISKKY